ncbi:peptidase M23 [Pueribacillus theae]|uniref:Peptidase M23 n=1 Tax=Pueribacillus theae TaxID=2171751 RepID=A0A2U1K5F9_9BACI|nr:M23 family metallopeptidase [Pueribacillus theae]PWA12612.1 peptidase M23 [Pueribacillus theae]
MNRKLLGMFLSTSLVASSVITIPGMAQAKSIDDIRAEKAATNAEKQKKQSEIEKLKSEQQAVKNQIAKIDSQMAKTSDEIVAKQEEIAKKEEEIEKLKKDIEELEIRIAERDKLLKERVASMQVNGAVNYLDVLLGSQSFGDFLDRVLALNIIADQDRTIIEEQKADLEALEKKKQEVEEIRNKIQNELESLKKLRNELKAQLEEKDRLSNELASEEEDLHDELGEIEHQAQILAAEEAAYIQQKKEEEAARKRAEEAARKQASAAKQSNVASAASSPSSVKSGSSPSGSSSSSAPEVSHSSSSGFIMPASGRFTSSFGSRVHPISGRVKNHNGVDIANSIGTPIRAAASGKVIYAGTMSGYGNTVMIAHTINGKSYTTLYAHMSAFSVRNGQSVSQGQQIGKIGNTGASTGPHLHFEVHPGGYKNPVNPMQFL